MPGDGGMEARGEVRRWSTATWMKILIGIVLLTVGYRYLSGSSGAGGTNVAATPPTGAVPAPNAGTPPSGPPVPALQLPDPTANLLPGVPGGFSVASSMAALSKVHLMCAYVGSGMKDIANQLLLAPAIQAVQACSQRQYLVTGSINPPPRGFRACEVRYDVGDPEARQAATAILTLLTGTTSGFSLTSALRNSFLGMGPSLRPVDGDPIQLTTGTPTPAGSIPILVVLVR